MLVLGRKLADHLMFGANIRITVISLEKNRVRLGIEAPPQVNVLRGEVVARDRDSLPREPEAASPSLGCGVPSEPAG